MDVVLRNIHYNSKVFSKIVEDFEDFLACTKPGAFQKSLNKISKSFPEANLICEEMTTDKLEEGLKALKKKPEIYYEDFYQVETILESADPEEEFDKWFANFRAICTFFTTLLWKFYGAETVKDILRP